MKVYLIRHGQTGGNVAHRHQAKTTPLSIKGRHQAEEVAKEIKDFNPTHLVSSSLVRAIETASVIGEACGLVPETTEHFIELERPKHLYGHYHRSVKSVWFYVQWYLGRGTATQAGESYVELRARFLVAQEFLAQYPDDSRLVVVSHSVFMSLFIAHLCRDKALNPIQAVFTFRQILTMPNTNIVPLQLDQAVSDNTCAWSVNTKLESSPDSGSIVPPG